LIVNGLRRAKLRKSLICKYLGNFCKSLVVNGLGEGGGGYFLFGGFESVMSYNLLTIRGLRSLDLRKSLIVNALLSKALHIHSGSPLPQRPARRGHQDRQRAWPRKHANPRLANPGFLLVGR